eukprot:CAMPEP_0119388020 /NCGR_PEP_ID=MMETSP1334-20130426/103242_1 /TAXON_ID=127549 /ORGANISM="Calcidiscus leptoporus, Strain RCC1130" /LENGTH=46 /DNA_ID= /DNA_START= /DNA_END= /DNA_ORIENTATION=
MPRRAYTDQSCARRCVGAAVAGWFSSGGASTLCNVHSDPMVQGVCA